MNFVTMYPLLRLFMATIIVTPLRGPPKVPAQVLPHCSHRQPVPPFRVCLSTKCIKVLPPGSAAWKRPHLAYYARASESPPNIYVTTTTTRSNNNLPPIA